MTEVVKIISTHFINDKSWVEAYTNLREYQEIADELGQEEKDRLEEFVSSLREAGMEVLNTNNYVAFGEISNDSNTIALVELDYAYTSKKVKIIDYFEENEELYVTLEEIN